MAPIVTWIVVAFVVAAGVLLVALVAGGRSGGVRGFVTDLRAGLRGKKDDDGPGMLADTRRELVEAADAESASIEELFDIGEPQDVAYLGTSDHTRR